MRKVIAETQRRREEAANGIARSVCVHHDRVRRLASRGRGRHAAHGCGAQPRSPCNRFASTHAHDKSRFATPSCMLAKPTRLVEAKGIARSVCVHHDRVRRLASRGRGRHAAHGCGAQPRSPCNRFASTHAHDKSRFATRSVSMSDSACWRSQHVCERQMASPAPCACTTIALEDSLLVGVEDTLPHFTSSLRCRATITWPVRYFGVSATLSLETA